jgi:hypothetical protein
VPADTKRILCEAVMQSAVPRNADTHDRHQAKTPLRRDHPRLGWTLVDGEVGKESSRPSARRQLSRL